MNKILALFLFMILVISSSSGQGKKSALLLIDIQDFYFPGGRSALVEPERAASNAAKLLEAFRQKNLVVIHVRHNSEPGGKINDLVSPHSGEKIISKNEISCFKGTELADFLRMNGIDTLVICGMQTHMCVEAAARTASDLGYKCILVHDACATKDLNFGNRIIKSDDVHYSTLSTLKSYAKVISTAEYLSKKQD